MTEPIVAFRNFANGLKFERKIPLERDRGRWYDNIKIVREWNMRILTESG